MRVGNRAQTEGLYWLLGDHLGSTAVTADGAGNKYGEVRYKAWGETRFTSGNTPTTFRFTGQRQEENLGLYFYNARWYDPYLNRWIQPDTIIPQNQGVQSWDRYAYVSNNPLKHVDPSGHYGVDVHYDLTWEIVYSNVKEIAINKGYKPSSAERLAKSIADQVAAADLAADAYQKVTINNNNRGVQGEAVIIKPENVGISPLAIPFNDSPTPHWCSTEQAITLIEEADSLDELGLAYHAYQDSYSHAKKLNDLFNNGDVPLTPQERYWAHGRMNFYKEIYNIDNFDPINNFTDKEMQEDYDPVVWDWFNDYID